MNIDVNVSDIKLTDEVDQQIQDRDEEGYPIGRSATIADLVAEKIADRLVRENNSYYKSLRERVNMKIDALITERVKPLVDEAIAKPIRKTNTYGEPTGAETTLTEMIIDGARKWLEAPTGDSYDRNRKPMARKLVDEAVGAALTKELAMAIAAEREKVVIAVRTQAADIIARSVVAGVGGK